MALTAIQDKASAAALLEPLTKQISEVELRNKVDLPGRVIIWPSIQGINERFMISTYVKLTALNEMPEMPN